MTMTESTPQTAPQTAPPAAPAPSTELLVSMTEAASAKVMELRSREGKSEAALRLFVKSGGCSGFSYGLAFDDKIADDDRVEDHAGVPMDPPPRRAAATSPSFRQTRSPGLPGLLHVQETLAVESAALAPVVLHQHRSGSIEGLLASRCLRSVPMVLP